MKDPEAEMAKLLERAECLESGAARVAVLEEAIALADLTQDLDAGYAIRKQFLLAALEAGDYERLLVAFAWCLGQADRHPERFSESEILWEYRWVISALPKFQGVPRAKIDEMLADMIRRYQAAGASMRPVHLLRRKVAISLGDAAMAADASRKWSRAPIDEYTDSKATEIVFSMSYEQFRNRHERVLKLAAPFLNGTLRDKYFEASACEQVLLPLLRRKQPAQAMAHHRRGYKLRVSSSRPTNSMGMHIGFLALTDNLPRALRLFEKHFPYTWRSSPRFDCMEVMIDLLPLFERLTIAGQAAIKVRLPEDCAVYRPDGVYDPVVLYDWIRSTAAELAAGFDARNGNDYFTKLIQAAPRLQRLFMPCSWKS